MTSAEICAGTASAAVYRKTSPSPATYDRSPVSKAATSTLGYLLVAILACLCPPKALASERKPLVIIDAGHGGHDPGALSVAGGFEKDITLGIALQIRDTLLNDGKVRVLLTRSKDLYIAPYVRRKIAQGAQADLLISIHADIAGDPTVRGLAAYALSDEEGERVLNRVFESKRRNPATNISNPNEYFNIIDIIQREVRNLSIKFADIVSTLNESHSLKARGYRFAGFAVLKAHDVPSVLIEAGFISNADDAQYLKTGTGKKQVAQHIVKSIYKYFYPGRHTINAEKF